MTPVIKTNDGRYLYKAFCIECGIERPPCAKKHLSRLCRACSAKKNRSSLSNLETARQKKNNKIKENYINVDFNNFIELKCGVKKYLSKCVDCGKEKGYQTLNNAKRSCRTCMAIKNSNNSFQNIDKHDFIYVFKEKRRAYKQNCLYCYELVGYRQIKNYDSPCEACLSKGITRAQRSSRKRLRSSMKSSIYHRLKKRLLNKNRKSTFDLLGYSVNDLKKHIEAKFQPGMSWENYGEWHIDHVIPDSWFNYSSTDDIGFKQSWSLDNLQPLWAKDNLTKSNKFIG